MTEWKPGRAPGTIISGPVSREEAERLLGKRLEDIPKLKPRSSEEIERDLRDPEFQAIFARHGVPLEAGHKHGGLGRFRERLRERRVRARAALEIAKREDRKRKQEAVRLEAERQARLRERNVQLIKRYGDMASISVGAGILAAVVIAIATHATRESWLYANSIREEGYPPLWLWAGTAASIATAGAMYRWRK
jgi:hypothetical protein